MPAAIKIITVVYFFILAGIVFLADRKGTRYLLGFVKNIPYGDKIGHFVLMGVFSFLVNLALENRNLQIGNFRYLLGSLIVSAIVTLEEISQIYIRVRSFDVTDLLADYLGIFLFGELARFVYQKGKSRKQASRFGK